MQWYWSYEKACQTQRRKICFGTNPSVLIDTVIWLCGIHFTLHLTQDQIKLHEPSNGAYLEYHENSSKNNPGGFKQRKLQPKAVANYANTSNPSYCFVRIYSLYMSKCPDEVSGNCFFLKPPKEDRSS